MAGSWATKMLQPASFGVAKKSPGAIPGVKSGALGSSWKDFINIKIYTEGWGHHEQDILI